MNIITKDAVISLLLTCFPNKKKKDFIVRRGKYTDWIYVKIDDTYYGPNELYSKTGIDLRGLKLYNENNKTDNIKLWKDLILK